MLLSLIAAAVLVAPADVAPARAPDEGAVAWFEGTYEEALAQAAAEERLVLVDFWTDWCVWCKRLDADVFSQDSVAAALSDVVCVSLNAEGVAGAPIAMHFNVTSFPTLLLLNPDGSVRDSIRGYLSPEDFIAEVERIEADVDTISALRRKVEANPADIEARYEFAQKLERVGDKAGHAEQLAAILELDPEGKSLPGRRLRYEAISKQIDAQASSGQYTDLTELHGFLEVETDQELLFVGYGLAWRVEEFHSRLSAIDGSEPEVVEEYKVKQLIEVRKAWEHVPEDMRALFGNQVAWTTWEQRDTLSDEHKAFALELARAAHATDVDDTSLLDTLACVLFMNGDREGALEKVRRCLELDPDGKVWTARLEEFQTEG